MRWIRANERLGEFKDSDIPDWKFWHPDFCKVNGEPMEGGFFRQDTMIKTIVFSYVYIRGTDFRHEVEEKDFHTIEYLDESPDSKGSANAEKQVSMYQFEQMVSEIYLILTDEKISASQKIEEVYSKYTITKKP
jgi:hypothetical protein